MMSTYPEKPLRCVIPPPPPQSIEDKIKEQQLLLLTKQVEYYCLKIEQLKGGVMSDKPKESAIEPIGEPCQVKSDAFCLVEFTDTDKYLARISNNPVGWIDELRIYAISNQSAIDTLTAENERLRDKLDKAVGRLNEAMGFIDIFFGNCVYSKEHETSYDSEISRVDYNSLLDFKVKIINSLKESE